MQWHVASIWETVADTVPDAPAVADGEVRRSWRDYEDRAARIAGALAAAGHGPGCKVAVYAHNSNAFLEAYFGAFKLRGVPVNVNYRYTESELTYLLGNADAEALVFDARFAAKVEAIRPRLPLLRTLIEIEDGSGLHLDGAWRLEEAIATHDPYPRQVYAEDDLFILYTGGTTGMPKGVMSLMGDRARVGVAQAFNAQGLPPPSTRDELVASIRRLHAEGRAPVSLVACPLMHGTGLTGGAHRPHLAGACAVTLRAEHFDAHALWRVVEREKVTQIAIVGDTFARPMLAALEAAAAQRRPYDLASLKAIVSAGVMFSREVKEGLLTFADITIHDAMAATEGAMATSIVSRAAPPVDTANFARNPLTRVFDDNDREILPGSEAIGMVAAGGPGPMGYYKDPEKTARTFRVIGGQRYAFPGDYAKVAADGSLILLGRGSNCINTGGEKVFPEEVEEALKAHPDVEDCLVVGVPDERFGQRITAVLSLADGRALDEAGLLAFVRTRLAGYKTPRRLIVVDHVQRAPSGKADYAWARDVATGPPTK
ncbi:MAG TPA: AMP-binding protein [Caulobacteraceae bacterium]|nr:AMP-binding protein [Caulobacteraceae bacterium]